MNPNYALYKHARKMYSVTVRVDLGLCFVSGIIFRTLEGLYNLHVLSSQVEL